MDKSSPNFWDDKLEILNNSSFMKSLIAWQEYVSEFPVYEPFCFEGILFFILYRGFLQITPFVRKLQALFLLGLEVQVSLNVCAIFPVS